MYPPIAITAVGVVSPLGVSLDNLSETLACKSDMPDPIPIEDFFKTDIHSLSAIEASDLNLHPKEARIMDKHSLMLLMASEEAYKKAGLFSYSAEEIGLFAALGMVDYHIEDLLPSVKRSMKEGLLDYRTFFKRGYQEIYPLWPLSMLNNIALCQVSIRLNIRGENAVFSPHSDSSLQAIHEAAMAIAGGHCNTALAGGVSEVVSTNSLIRYVLCNTDHSRVVGQTERKTLPYKMAEGSAILSLEMPPDANKRGASAIAIIAGFGSAFGFDHIHGGPTIEAIQCSMKKALESAEIRPSKVDAIFSHHNIHLPEGANEKLAIERLFGNSLLVFNTKAQIGDMLSGAGSFDTAIAVAKLKRREIKYALVNAFSVEGGVASMLVRGAY